MTQVQDLRVGGTMIWYYYICHRQVWLIGHQLEPDPDDENVEYGRFLHETRYPRRQTRREILIGGSRIDLLDKDGKTLIVGEVKKSSRAMESSRMQLLFYLHELERVGFKARGELRIPEERRVERLELNDETRIELDKVIRDVLRILYLKEAPPAKKISWCRQCAYRELCWA